MGIVNPSGRSTKMYGIFLAAALFAVGSQTADSHGVTVARAFLVALNSKQKPEMENFIDAHFMKSANGRSTSDRADSYMGLSNIGVPASLDKVLIDEPLA